MKCFASLHSHFQLKAASFVDATGRSQAIRQPFNLIEPLEIVIQLQMKLWQMVSGDYTSIFTYRQFLAKSTAGKPFLKDLLRLYRNITSCRPAMKSFLERNISMAKKYIYEIKISITESTTQGYVVTY